VHPSIRGGAGPVPRVISSSRRKRWVGCGAAARPGRSTDREQGPPHGAPDPRPGVAQPRVWKTGHDIHRGVERLHRRRQGARGISPGRRVGPVGRDRRPVSRQGPASRDRGPAPDAIVGRRQGRSALEDGDRRREHRDAVRPEQEGLRGRAGRGIAGRPGRVARRSPGERTDRRGRVRARHRRGRRHRTWRGRGRGVPLRAVAAHPRAGRRTRRRRSQGCRRRASAVPLRASWTHRRSRSMR